MKALAFKAMPLKSAQVCTVDQVESMFHYTVFFRGYDCIGFG